MNLNTNVIQIIANESIKIPLRFGIMSGLTFNNVWQLLYVINKYIAMNTGTIIIMSITNVVLICIWPLCMSLIAMDSASLLRNPFPRPISKESIHISIELMVSHIPYSY